MSEDAIPSSAAAPPPGPAAAPLAPPAPPSASSMTASPEAPTAPATPAARRPRGFAGMDRALVREIARRGGKAVHAAGTAHEFTTEEAREAGRKGGQASHKKRRVEKRGTGV